MDRLLVTDADPQRSCKMERERKVLFLLFIAVGVIWMIIYFEDQSSKEQKKKITSFVEEHDKPKKVESICDTRECAEIAKEMIKSMDNETSPCDNFYQFACGNWLKHNPFPDSKTSWDQFAVVRDRISTRIKEILETEVDAKDPLPLNIAKEFYSSCLSQSPITRTQELYEFTWEVFEGWELDPNKLGTKLGELRRMVAGNFIIATSVELDAVKSTNHRVYIDQPTLGIDRNYLVQEPTEHPEKRAYVKFIEDFWRIFYPDVVNPEEVAKRLLDFETELAKISTNPEEERSIYNPMTLDMLSNLTKNATVSALSKMINWKEYIKETFQGVNGLGDLETLVVIVKDISYFQEFGHILQKTIDEDQDVIWDYLKWRIIWEYWSDGNLAFRHTLLNYEKKSSSHNTTYRPPRWEICKDRANSLFGMAISYHYVQDLFKSSYEKQIAGMIGYIKEAIYDILWEADWFSGFSSRTNVRRKVGKIKAFIGYPEWLLDKTGTHSALAKVYKDLPEQLTGNHFRNMVKLITWKNMDNLKQIGRTKDKTKWIIDPTDVNAFYAPLYNSITFPSGIIQPPFYFPGKPIQALNYGALGVIIGHELTHGLGGRGGVMDKHKYNPLIVQTQRNGDGDLMNYWWDKWTFWQFNKRAKCFVDQYSNYTVKEADNMQVNGLKTFFENIADNGGLRQAFRAYQSYIKENGPDQRLPGLEYSAEQLFFIAFSQTWCGAYTKEGLIREIQTDGHSPNRFRVRGALQNSVEFAEAWDCPKPDKRSICRIW